MQFESEPAGAEARTSTGQTCRTPCSLAVAASEFTVSFALPGYQPQTVPVRVVASTEPRDPNSRRRRGAAPGAEPGVCRIAAGGARRGARKKPAPRRKSPSPRRAPRRPPWRPSSAAPGPRAGFALAARAAALKGLIVHDMPHAAAQGRPHCFAFLDMARTGSLKRSRSGA